ncbi:transposase [Streptomyces sp. NPDC057757]|uniref:transposase n=1 Tax=Streptomyces sp. NPDC057757 TaxID=3346241 RepID=UPI0036A9EE81
MPPATEYEFRTGSQWVHLPERYGNWRGVYNQLRMWAVDGTWEGFAGVSPGLGCEAVGEQVQESSGAFS